MRCDECTAWPPWLARLGLGGSFAYRPGNLSLAWGGGRGTHGPPHGPSPMQQALARYRLL